MAIPLGCVPLNGYSWRHTLFYLLSVPYLDSIQMSRPRIPDTQRNTVKTKLLDARAVLTSWCSVALMSWLSWKSCRSCRVSSGVGRLETTLTRVKSSMFSDPAVSESFMATPLCENSSKSIHCSFSASVPKPPNEQFRLLILLNKENGISTRKQGESTPRFF